MNIIHGSMISPFYKDGVDIHVKLMMAIAASDKEDGSMNPNQ
jgi:hypothetical protein